jgi:hypothetical protein
MRKVDLCPECTPVNLRTHDPESVSKFGEECLQLFGPDFPSPPSFMCSREFACNGSCPKGRAKNAVRDDTLPW